MTDFRKSINSILYERSTSPLFGSFAFSWLIWNWKIIIVLFFASSKELGINKLDYIDDNLINVWSGFINPAVSTLLLLTLYEWLSVQSYKLWLFFQSKKNKHKNNIEDAKLLTLEQSQQLRMEIAKQEEQFDNILRKKEDLITALQQEIKELQIIVNSKQEKVSDDDFEKFFKNEYAVSYFDFISEHIQNGKRFTQPQIPSDAISHYIAFGLLNRSPNGLYQFSDNGREYLKEHLRRKDIEVRKNEASLNNN